LVRERPKSLVSLIRARKVERRQVRAIRTKSTISGGGFLHERVGFWRNRLEQKRVRFRCFSDPENFGAISNFFVFRGRFSPLTHIRRGSFPMMDLPDIGQNIYRDFSRFFPIFFAPPEKFGVDLRCEGVICGGWFQSPKCLPRGVGFFKPLNGAIRKSRVFAPRMHPQGVVFG